MIKEKLPDISQNDSPVLGKTHWAIADGYIPGQSNGPIPELESHDTICILNSTKTDAHIRITIFYVDREPSAPYEILVPAQRTKHIRFNNLTDPEVIPKDTDFASIVESDVPIIVQHTRLDSRQAENALFSTIAFSE
ncbi:MAG: sensory rhodopsin transducer [Oligoflexia bacterium]|nr:sensory rhodopsin transducer [Oligoflexia bacterium]